MNIWTQIQPKDANLNSIIQTKSILGVEFETKSIFFWLNLPQKYKFEFDFNPKNAIYYLIQIKIGIFGVCIQSKSVLWSSKG